MGSEVSSGLFYFHAFSQCFSITASLVGSPTKVAYGALLIHSPGRVHVSVYRGPVDQSHVDRKKQSVSPSGRSHFGSRGSNLHSVIVIDVAKWSR